MDLPPKGGSSHAILVEGVGLMLPSLMITYLSTQHAMKSSDLGGFCREDDEWI